jgi:hypothetical protein
MVPLKITYNRELLWLVSSTPIPLKSNTNTHAKKENILLHILDVYEYKGYNKSPCLDSFDSLAKVDP